MAAVGGAGFVACLALLYTTMHDVLRSTGGFCASGGPYVVAHACPAGTAGRTVLAILGLIVAGGVFAGACSWAGGSSLAAGLAMWSALFGTLGVGFLITRNGSRVTGIVFETMATMGLAGLAALTVDLLRDGGDSGPLAGPEIVRAAVRPPMP